MGCIELQTGDGSPSRAQPIPTPMVSGERSCWSRPGKWGRPATSWVKLDMRAVIVTTHPIQYQAPLFRLLAKQLDLQVVFMMANASRTGSRRVWGRIRLGYAVAR